MRQIETERHILILNGGSSSLKFAVRQCHAPDDWRLRGRFERIGMGNADFIVNDSRGSESRQDVGPLNHAAATGFLLDRMEECLGLGSVAAVGHRIVHGGPRYAVPEVIDGAMIEELGRLRPFAPEHLPSEFEIIATCRQRLENVPQVACFDTAFHSGLPREARMLPIPLQFQLEGVVRYGFHGLSYTHVLDSLRRDAGEVAACGRLVLAHLGNGASLAAVRDGRSIDTTMGFTPAAGIPMGTRSGDLDPGLVRYLAETAGIDAVGYDRMANHESGLLGMSETSSDVRDLLASEETDVRAADALALFCYSIKKQIGAYAAALGGLDTLVFTGGIGEHSPVIRERVCAGLSFLGIELDPSRNRQAAPVISAEGAHVQVRVIAADEEAVIAKAVNEILNRKEPSQ